MEGLPSRVWLVVGLGNPGPAYRGTFHNAGREVAERLAAKREVKFRKRGDALVAEIAEGFIMLPETFMNNSGEAVKPFLAYRNLGLESLLVLVDDVYIETGKIRLRPRGADAGHNGLRSIDQHVGSQEYARIRIGAGPDPGGAYRTDYVLSRPRPEVAGPFFEGHARALAATEAVLAQGVETAMNIFNA